MPKSLLFVLLVICFNLPSPAQRRVDPRNTHERILSIVPLIGKGTYEDPVRPMFAPLPSEMDPQKGTGIIAFAFQVSDDGKFALVEFVARTRDAFQHIQASKLAGVQTFVKSQDSQAAIEAQFKLLKKDFDISKFGVRMP